MKKITILYFILLAAVQLNAYEKRDLLQHAADLAKIKEALVMEQKWVPYPDYTDRNGWNQFLGEYKEGIIRQGEKYLNFDWKVVRATDYMEYERSGNRRIMEDPLGANNTAIGALVLAEMAEGKGRFIDEIINGVLQACEMTSWSLSAHLASAQHTHRAFPDFREDIMDLVSGNMSQMLSWTYHFYIKNSIRQTRLFLSVCATNCKSVNSIPICNEVISGGWLSTINRERSSITGIHGVTSMP